MDPADLDDPLDRALKALPTPRAPKTLLPRVLAATVERPTTAPAPTGWFTWPLAWRIGSVAALLLAAAGIWMLAASGPSGVSDAARVANDTATVVRVVWDVLVQPVATYIFVLGFALALTCAAAWAALELALGGASHR